LLQYIKSNGGCELAEGPPEVVRPPPVTPHQSRARIPRISDSVL
jgi:hypothetical protein